MGFRKIIGFGDSSFVVSLPKEWVQRNGLKKGDTINVEEEASELKLSPQNIKQSQINKEVNIKFDGNLKLLKSQLFNSYIHNFSTININMKGINSNYSSIKKLVNDFVALDIIQSSDDKIIIKDYLNIQDISIHEKMRRMDRIVMSMFEDVQDVLKGNFNKKEFLNDRDEEVNKIYTLILKLLKRAMINPNDRKILNLKIEEVFYYWDLSSWVEEVADQLKRIVRYVNLKVDRPVLELFDLAYENYKQSMKANFTGNLDLCLDIMNLRKDVADKCESCAKSLGVESMLILERIKTVHNCTGNISKAYIKLGVKA